jgi:TP901 family phage tail tape measure protein
LAGASLTIGANNSTFRKAMNEINSELKGVQSNFNLASTKAKLYGTETDRLKVKQQELTSKMSLQGKQVTIINNRINSLKQDSAKYGQTQQDLTKKIDDTNKKYKESVAETGKSSTESKKLKEEIAKLKEEYGQNEKAITTNNKQLQNAQIQLNNTEAAILENEKALADMNREIQNTKLDNLADKFDKVSTATGNASDKLKPISTAIVGIGTASAVASISFEDNMAKVSTIADHTVVSYDDMKKSILDLSNQTGISAAAIADDVYNAISAGQSTGDAVNFVTESTKLAKAGFAESGQSLDLLTTIMNSYGMEATEVGKVSDMLIQIQNKGKTTVADLSSTMGKIIPTANSMGVSLDQLGAGYALMTSKGIATAETTTYMNSLLNELGKTGTKASKGLKEGTGKSFQELIKSGVPLGDVLVMLDKEAKKNNLSLADMFGSAEAGKAALVLVGNEGKDFNGLLKDMQGSLGATNTAFEIVDNTTGSKLKKSLNQVKNTGIAMGDTLAPVITMLANGFSSITTVLSSLSTTQLQTIAGIGAGVVTINLALGAFSKLTGGIRNGIKAYRDIRSTGTKAIETISNFGTKALEGAKSVGNFALNLGKAAIQFGKTAIQTGISTVQFIAHKVATLAGTIATNGLALAQAALNFIMSLNPITLIVIAIGALIAAIILLWNKCDWFRNLVTQMFEGLKIAWNATIEFFKGIWNGFVAVWNVAVEAFKVVWQGVCDFFKLIWQGVCLYFETLFNFWKGVFNTVVEGIKLIWNSACTIVKSVWKGVCTTFKTLFEGFKTIFTTITNALKSIWKGVCSIFSSAWDGVCNGITSVFTGVKNTVVGIAQSMTNTVIRAINWCITQLNKIKFSVPDWVPLIGGKSWGVNIPKVSEVSWLYKGGIISSPTVMGNIGVGDKFQGTGKQAEAIIPLEVMYSKIRTILGDVVNGPKNSKQIVNGNSDIILQIENFYNNKDTDVRALMEEMEFYRKQIAFRGGGK